MHIHTLIFQPKRLVRGDYKTPYYYTIAGYVSGILRLGNFKSRHNFSSSHMHVHVRTHEIVYIQ